MFTDHDAIREFHDPAHINASVELCPCGHCKDVLALRAWSESQILDSTSECVPYAGEDA
jgi:hypothetical protein